MTDRASLRAALAGGAEFDDMTIITVRMGDLRALLADYDQTREALTDSVRELHACQAVIHLAGGFDPAYVNGAQAALKKARAALAQEAHDAD